jgi:hypothetical protein
MKPLLAACALAALVIALLIVQRDDRGTAPKLPALANVAPATDGDTAEFADTLSTEAAPVTARVEAMTDRAESAPTPATSSATAHTRVTATLTVRVVDEDGAGVYRANVVLQPTPDELPALRTGNGNGHTFVQGSTDRGGRVTLEVSAGRALELRAGGFGELSEGSVLVDSLAAGAFATATITVKTRADIELEGRVVDAESGAPLPGIELRMEQQTGFRTSSRSAAPRPLPPSSEPDVVTDAAGRFRIPAKSWATATALLTGSGWSPRIARLRQADATRAPGAAAGVKSKEPEMVEIALRRAARIEGTVRGAPGPALVRVTLAGHGLVTDEHTADWVFSVYGTDYLLITSVDTTGAFTIEDVPAGASLSLSLVAAQKGELLLQEPQPVQIASGATHQVNWTIGTGGRFDCSVHHAAGAPAPNEELWLLAPGPAHPGETEADWEPLQRAKTDVSGRAEFQDVQPGSWVVALAPSSQRSANEASVRYAVAATIEAPGDSVPVQLTLHTGLYITGTILAPDGTPTSTYVSAGNADFRVDAKVRTVKGGKFRLGPLLPGRYRLSAHGLAVTPEGGTPLTDSDPVMAEAGAEGVEIWLRAGCDFELSAIDSATSEPTACKFTLIPQEWESVIHTGGSRPTATLSGQAPGRYHVLARTEQGLVGSVEFEAAAGERRALTVPVALGGSVQVGYRGAAPSLTAWLERSGSRVGSLYVSSGGSETLLVPAGSYTLRTFVRHYDKSTEALNRVNEATRAVEITAGGKVSIEIEH